MREKSKRYLVRVWGETACFTSPSKMERDSYPVITPSAARGILDSILWKPGMRWVIHKVYVVNPIRYICIRRNEMKTRSEGSIDRDLRTTRALQDVEYIIEASFYVTDLAGPRDNLQKFIDMFERRMSKGQSYRDPFFGCREFPANVEMFEGDPADRADKEVDIAVGTMVYDFVSRNSNKFCTFDANIEHGVMVVPPPPVPEEIAC